MKIPKQIQPLITDGLVDSVVSQLMSGKEASVFVVLCEGELRCAKVYKDAEKRSFKKAVQYQEGRKVRNSRRARAMEKKSRFGRQQQEDDWQNAEVNALYRLVEAGVRVPTPYGCFHGVLLMELVLDDSGDVAPRLNDISLTEAQALKAHETTMNYVVRMLCCGLVHGDLSEFNVLMDAQGPVVIDLPQAVDAAANNNAMAMLYRDVNNMTQYFSQFAPQLKSSQYAREIWTLFEAGRLSADTVLTGEAKEDEHQADVAVVLQEIQAAAEDEQRRQDYLTQDMASNQE